MLLTWKFLIELIELDKAAVLMMSRDDVNKFMRMLFISLNEEDNFFAFYCNFKCL